MYDRPIDYCKDRRIVSQFRGNVICPEEAGWYGSIQLKPFLTKPT